MEEKIWIWKDMFTILIALCVHRILCNCPVHKVIYILKKVPVSVCEYEKEIIDIGIATQKVA